MVRGVAVLGELALQERDDGWVRRQVWHGLGGAKRGTGGQYQRQIRIKRRERLGKGGREGGAKKEG